MPTLNLPERFKVTPFDGDYYKILGLDSQSLLTRKQITHAYREAALQYHP